MAQYENDVDYRIVDKPVTPESPPNQTPGLSRINRASQNTIINLARELDNEPVTRMEFVAKGGEYAVFRSRNPNTEKSDVIKIHEHTALDFGGIILGHNFESIQNQLEGWSDYINKRTEASIKFLRSRTGFGQFQKIFQQVAQEHEVSANIPPLTFDIVPIQVNPEICRKLKIPNGIIRHHTEAESKARTQNNDIEPTLEPGNFYILAGVSTQPDLGERIHNSDRFISINSWYMEAASNLFEAPEHREEARRRLDDLTNAVVFFEPNALTHFSTNPFELQGYCEDLSGGRGNLHTVLNQVLRSNQIAHSYSETDEKTHHRKVLRSLRAFVAANKVYTEDNNSFIDASGRRNTMIDMETGDIVYLDAYYAEGHNTLSEKRNAFMRLAEGRTLDDYDKNDIRHVLAAIRTSNIITLALNFWEFHEGERTEEQLTEGLIDIQKIYGFDDTTMLKLRNIPNKTEKLLFENELAEN
jgi:hypothetical protein